MSPDDEDDRYVAVVEDKPPKGMPGCLAAFGFMLFLHAWMAVNVAVAFSFLPALFYAVIPPWAVFVALDQAAGFARFSVPVILVWSVLMFLIRRFGRWIRSRGQRQLNLAEWALLLPILLVWPMLLSGEIVRFVAMQNALIRAQPECYQTQSLWLSVHEWGDSHVQAHAWMITAGKRYVWSYRKMAFSPDHRPIAYGGRCTTPRVHISAR